MTRSLHSTRPPDFASWGGTPMIRYYVPYDPFAPKIGIGGHLAALPLPHHRAYGSRTRRFDGVKLGHQHGVGARAGLWGAGFATTGSVPWQPPTGVSP